MDGKEKMYPPDISVIRFASARAQEIVALSKIIGKFFPVFSCK